MRASVAAVGGGAVSSRQAAQQRREACVPPSRTSHNAHPLLPAARGRRTWATAADSAGSAANAVTPPPAAAEQQQQQREQQPAIDYRQIPASVEFVYDVDKLCTLRVSGKLPTEPAEKQPLSEASRAALLAAALVALHKRSVALDAALKLARERFPDLLAPAMLKEFDRMQAAGEPRAALTVFYFDEMMKLCEKVAPEVAEQVLEEIVAVGALMQSYWLEPVPPQAASGAGGSGAAAGESTASGGAGQAPAADVSAAGALAADPAAAAAAAAAPAAEARAAAGGSAAGGSAAEPQPQQGGAFRVKKGIDPVQLLPQRLVRTGEWQQWNRRLRDAIIAWQRQAAAEARDQKQAAAAAAAGSADGPAAAGGGSQAAAAAGGAAATAAAAQAGPPQPAQDLQAAFIIHSCTPDEVAMKHELRIKVPRQQGIALRNQLERDPHVVAQILQDLDLISALCAPEPRQERYLETTAFQRVRLGRQLSFSCTLPGAAPPADSGSSGSSDGSSSGSSNFEFSGSAVELDELVLAVAYLEGSVMGLETTRWVPMNARIQLRRLPAGSTGGRGQRQQPADEARFELAVWPAGGSAGAPGAAAAQQGQPAVARLSQGQLNALLDCLDAFCKQHPAFSHKLHDWDGPLVAPEPRLSLRKRVAAPFQQVAALWQRPAKGAADGAAGGEGGSSGSSSSSSPGGEAGGTAGASSNNSSSAGTNAADGVAVANTLPGSTAGGTFV